MHYSPQTNIVILAILLPFIFPVGADVYLHNPRGSNNRLNEPSATRTNNNRLFDSQNNARGGYNVGEKTKDPFTTEAEQYNMVHLASGTSSVKANSQLTVEWSNQHGCGGQEDSNPYKLNCNVVLQFMCTDEEPEQTLIGRDTLRNGKVTDTPPYTPPASMNEDGTSREVRYQSIVNRSLGLHEPVSWYDSCYQRPRNTGLFLADEKLTKTNVFKVSSAIFSRQNPAGTRRGYECPEERDYYPYWETSPWIDIAVLTDNTSMCGYYERESFNSRPRSGCVEPSRRGGWSRFTTAASCQAAGGRWVEAGLYSFLDKVPTARSSEECARVAVSSRVSTLWAVPYDSENGTTPQCLVQPDPLDCVQHPWTRVNHLGNSLGTLEMPRYDWRLPVLLEGRRKRCVLRIRYNISTDDYNPQATFGQSESPVKNDPTLTLTLPQSSVKLQLAVNTAQTGRTFQDRSHVFLLYARDTLLADMDDLSAPLYNLNVRGKRGNIVQTYPAVEYDFVPNRGRTTPIADLFVRPSGPRFVLSGSIFHSYGLLFSPSGEYSPTDLIHLQWTGSNTHANGAPGGDGQTGSDGQGAAGTDRHNFVVLTNDKVNYPTMFEWSGNSTESVWNLFREAQIVWSPMKGVKGVSAKDYAIYAATGGFLQCQLAVTCGTSSYENKGSLFSPLLDNAAPSFPGLIFRIPRPGVYRYMCTRNNNFSNRSQKGAFIVTN